MKKILAMLLVLAMVFALCACGDADSAQPAAETETTADTPAETQTAAAETNGEGDIYSWIINDDTSISGTVRFSIPFNGDQGMDAMIAEFNEIYPNIKVELNTYSNNNDGNVALNTAIMAGECDVVASFEIVNLINRMENGMYLDITDRVEEENISLLDNWGTEAYNMDGKTYVLPCGGYSYYVAINMDAWNEAGLGELPEEWTWDEYIDACRAMTKYNADGSTEVYGGSNYQVIADLLNVVYQVNGCNRFYKEDGSCIFNEDWIKDQMQKYIDAEQEGIMYSLDAYRSDNYKSWFAYTDGAVNSTIGANLARFLRDTEQYPMESITGFAPYPVMEKGQTNYMSGVNYLSFAGITIGCQDEEAAWAFVKWYSTYGSKYLTIAGHQSTWAGTDSSDVVSLIFGSEEDAAKIIDVDSFKKYVGNTANPSAYDTITVAYPQLKNIWDEYVMYAFTGDMTVSDALDTAAELGNKAIADA